MQFSGSLVTGPLVAMLIPKAHKVAVYSKLFNGESVGVSAQCHLAKMRSCAAPVALHAQKHPFTCSHEECSRGKLRACMRACIEKGDALFSWDLQIFPEHCQRRFAWLLALARASDLSQLEGDGGQKQKCLYRTVQHGAASTAFWSHCASEAAQCDVYESATGFVYLYLARGCNL